MSDGRQVRERTLRADAERNRRAILDAAEAVFAAEGTGVSLERIANQAGVGLGTIYRRFSSIDDLRDVVLEEKMALYADRTEQAAEEAAEHPWEALETWVRFVLDQQARNLAFSDAIISPRHSTKAFQDHVSRALAASEILVDRVQAAGVVRSDFDHTDLRLMQLAAAGIVHNARRSAVTASRRFAQYMLDAFRADEQTPLPPPPAPWVRAHRARRPAE
jgi:AcrR family transcriptional regulator